jgi:hypothetical protein
LGWLAMLGGKRKKKTSDSEMSEEDMIKEPERYAPIATHSEFLARGGWTSIGGSVIGPSHEDLSQCRQDEFAHNIVGDLYVAAIADGLGSAEFAQVGAAICCRHVVARIKEALTFASSERAIEPSATVRMERVGDPVSWAEVIKTSVLEVRSKLKPTHRKINGVVKPLFDTTLVGVVASPESGFFFHIGDGCGVAALSIEAGDFRQIVVSPPENGDFSNITYPVTMDGFEQHLRITPFTRANLIFLMTDGVTPFALEGDEKTLRPRFLQPIDVHLFDRRSPKGADALSQTLNGDDVRRSDRDDKTLVWARRRP